MMTSLALEFGNAFLLPFWSELYLLLLLLLGTWSRLVVFATFTVQCVSAKRVLRGKRHLSREFHVHVRSVAPAQCQRTQDKASHAQQQTQFMSNHDR